MKPLTRLLTNFPQNPSLAPFTSSPSLSAFPVAINEWITKNTSSFPDAETRRLGQPPNPKSHLNNLADLQKHELATLTQLRSNHSHLNQYLNKLKPLSDLACDCQEGIQSVKQTLPVHLRQIQQAASMVTQPTTTTPDQTQQGNPTEPPSVPTHYPVLQQHLPAQDPLDMDKNPQREGPLPYFPPHLVIPLEQQRCALVTLLPLRAMSQPGTFPWNSQQGSTGGVHH
ncbi:hypothetical protein CROQUDRAFT_662698 [Cronartium quercuum f. sp. fusiforme G11]|uniref:Uncharacterized protein n=1 Tax=Cronartium quercuum f. sp. fusiforme G11 TaxID=708437 RepID=A0A9P6T7R3_9BASI|nr:hypothetical protein CROQUDRAFT_662698 [Cronartium quercuum f. sp. fusiforme G11]